MSNQRFCDYCGVDTRDRHSKACPSPELDELRERIEALERTKEDQAADARCDCKIIKRPHILRDHWVPE